MEKITDPEDIKFLNNWTKEARPLLKKLFDKGWKFKIYQEITIVRNIKDGRSK